MSRSILSRTPVIFIIVLVFFLNLYFFKPYGTLSRASLQNVELKDKSLVHVEKNSSPARKQELKSKKTATSAGSPFKRKAPLLEAKKYKIAIIIDDFGMDYFTAEKFMKSDLNLTLSVMPFCPNSTRIAVMAKDFGKEVILHLPMEPLNVKDSESTMIKVSMTDEEIKQIIEAALKDIFPATGVNNHQGSRATQDKRVMNTVLQKLKEKNLYFIDSLTNYDSVAEEISREVKISFNKRDVFLDNEDNLDYITSQLWELVRLAKNKGYAIGIGHNNQNTLRALEEFKPSFEKENIELVFMKDLVK